jgi:hypothetical protein
MGRIMGCDHSLDLNFFLNQLNLHMFIFATDQGLWTHKLMNRIMDCDHSLCGKDILKFVYYFMILFLTVCIFKHFFTIS